jgi:hypothetical protein
LFSGLEINIGLDGLDGVVFTKVIGDGGDGEIGLLSEKTVCSVEFRLVVSAAARS